MSAKNFYLTTPIYYVNARPHIGHAYTTIVADVLARRHRLLGPNGDKETYFLTGTDEHGQKIERSAAAAGIPPQQFADEVAASFQTLWDRMGITYNQFIRTTDQKHTRGVQKLFADLYERGFIYLDSYTGQYSIGEEMFVEGPPGTIGPDGKPTETVTEENFFFRLSAFGDRIAALIESNELLITPDARRNEVLSFVRSGLKDLSISRSSFTWGIPVPEPAASTAKEKHVIYVWLDALANYMTAIGYGSDKPEDQAQFNQYWPADLHLVGKEIIRFHCVYWPAFLLAAGLELPKQITAHGWLLFDNSKMSKSKGNIVRTETILDAFGTLCPPKPAPSSEIVILSEAKDLLAADPATSAGPIPTENPTATDRDLFAADVLRYYLLREIPFGQDGSFSFDSLITRYNADLANGYGNLVSRTLSMITNFRAGKIPTWDSSYTAEISFVNFLFPQSINASGWSFESFEFSRCLESVFEMIAAVDSYFSLREPWKLAKSAEPSSEKDLNDILYTAAESIRIITSVLYPILPYATARVWAQLGLGDIELAAREGKLTNLQWGDLQPGTRLGPLAPIFPRADKGLAQIMTNTEEQLATGKLETGTLIPETPAQPASTDPAAPPRSGTVSEPALPVAGSHALTTGPDPTPSAPSTLDPEPSPQITIDDFAKIELRVAQITLAERIPKADKLLRLEVDLGPHGTRQILSGIAEFYTPEELLGRRIVVITNLAPRKMRGLESHGMLLAASEGDHGKPALATCGDEIALGARLK